MGLDEKVGVVGDLGDDLVVCGATVNGSGLGDDCGKIDTGDSVVVTVTGLRDEDGVDKEVGLGGNRGGGGVTGIGLGVP